MHVQTADEEFPLQHLAALLLRFPSVLGSSVSLIASSHILVFSNSLQP